MNYLELIKSGRSYRRFKQDPLPDGFLDRMVNYARLSPSTKNLQFLKFFTIEKKEYRDRVFPILKWAGALTEWDGPAPEEQPTGYVVILLDKGISPNPSCDHGIVAQSMVLGAAAEGVGCCMIATFGKKTLSETLNLPENLDPCLVLALGYPSEKVVMENCMDPGKTNYYRDGEDVHHVPKRPVKELLYKAE